MTDGHTNGRAIAYSALSICYMLSRAKNRRLLVLQWQSYSSYISHHDICIRTGTNTECDNPLYGRRIQSDGAVRQCLLIALTTSRGQQNIVDVIDHTLVEQGE